MKFGDWFDVPEDSWCRERSEARPMTYVTHTVCGQSLELRSVLVMPQADGDDGEERYEMALYCPHCDRTVTELEGDPVGPYVGVKGGDV